MHAFPTRRSSVLCLLPCPLAPQGFTNRNVIRSLSTIAWYFASSASSGLLPGGRVHTALGWSLVSFGLALTSLFASSVKPAASATAITCCSPTYPVLSSSAPSPFARCSTTPRTPPVLSTPKKPRHMLSQRKCDVSGKGVSEREEP